MSTPARTTVDPLPPILAVGPVGSVFLSADPSVRAALAHLEDHADMADRDDGDDRPPVPAGVRLFDRCGRELRRDATGASPTLVVADPTDRRGELCARIEEQFAYLRALAYRRPDLLDPGVEPAFLRPPEPPRTPLVGSTLPQPADEDYDDFFDTLGSRMSHVQYIGDADHPGSWWHNVFHRFG